MIEVKIITVDGTYKICEATILNVVTTNGQMGILPNHMPLVAMLQISKLSFETNNQREEYAIAGGMLYFNNNIATILVDTIESSNEIDIQRATEAKLRAEKLLSENSDKIDVNRAEIALKKALNRLSLK